VFAVSLTPFSTTLLAEFISYRKALLIYWLNILLLGAALHLSWECASGRGLVKDDIPPEGRSAIKRHVLIGQGSTLLAPSCSFTARIGASGASSWYS
jgi:uncharacterized membrane protein